MTKAVDKAYEHIRRMILTGAVAAGGALTENELAAEIGVSRTPVRNALQRLGAEGIVNFTTSRRASAPAWNSQEVEEVFRFRVMLESEACALAACHATAAEIAAMQALCDEMEECLARADKDRLFRVSGLNSRFHQAIVEASRSRRLGAMLQGVVDMPLILRTFNRYTPRELERSCGHHREILDALADHDGDWAGAVMQAHILAGRAAYVRCTSMQPQTDGQDRREA